MKKIFLVLLLLFSLSLSAQVIDSTLTKLIEEAVRLSPKISLLKNKQKASEAKVPQVSNLPDPMLSLGIMNLPTSSFSFTQEPMTGKLIGLSQAIPFPGKLNKAEQVFSKDSDIVSQEIDDAENEIVNEIRKVYYDLRFTREVLRLTNENKKLLKNIGQVVRAKYEVSRASQQSIIQVDVEITKLNDKIAELKGKESTQLAILNSYLYRQADSPINTETIPSISRSNYSIEELKTFAIENRPFLKGLELIKQKSELSEELAEFDYYPNFNISLQYSQRDKLSASNTPLDDFLSIMVGFNLPLNYGGKNSAKVEEAQMMRNMYIDQYNMSLQSLDKNFGVALAKLSELEARDKLIEEGLMLQALQSFQAALASYQVGEIDFINVLETQRKLYEIEINQYDLRTQYQKELSQLDFLKGAKINNKYYSE